MKLNHIPLCKLFRLAIWLQAVLVALCLTTFPINAQEDRPLVFRSDQNYPPYEFVEDGKPVGFNIDIIKAVAKVMGMDIEIRPGPWSVIRNQLENGEIDGLTGMFYSRERDARVDFSMPFITVFHSIFVRDGSSVDSLEDLRNREIIVQQDDIMNDWLTSQKLDVRIIVAEDQVAALRLLASGDYDAALLGTLQGLYNIQRFNLMNVEPVGEPFLPRSYAFAVREGDRALLEKLNEGLRIIRHTGQYDGIRDKWFAPYEEIQLQSFLFTYGVPLVTLLLVLLAGAFIWTWALRRSVEQKTRELRRTEMRYRKLYENIIDGFVSTDLEGRFLDFNQPYLDMLGYTADELRGKTFRSITAEKWREMEDRIIADQILPRGYSDPYEKEYVRKDGTVFPVELRSYLIRDEDGIPYGYWAFVRDITERKRIETAIKKANAELEERVAERTADLDATIADLRSAQSRLIGLNRDLAESNAELRRKERMLTMANQEMEAFSYSVSHDLRSPLRSINGFSDALIDEYSDKLGEEGKDFLGRIHRATLRMGTLIEGMLMLSRLSRKEMVFRRVDLSTIVHDIVTELQRNEPERKADIMVEPGVIVEGDDTLLRVALENLLSNAWKFTGNREITCVTFGTQEVDGQTVYFVRDNGAGFDMEFINKLFNPFQRLHRESDFAGTGIGLATVKRVIRRHNGRVWAEGASDNGATFYFTLNEQLADE